MKNWISISLHWILWLVVMATPTSDTYACGSNCCKKPEKQPNSVQKEAKKSNCCQKAPLKCQHSNKKDSKKGCGDNCNCSTNNVIVADLPQKIRFLFLFQTIFIEKNIFLYQQPYSKQVLQAIWQPPIIQLS